MMTVWKPEPWMPLFAGDYLADTVGLNNSEHGVYLRSMMKYWSKGEALTSAELRSICTERHIDKIAPFFTFEGNRWHHKRIDEELKKSRDRWNAIKSRSRLGVEARRKLGQIPAEL